MPHRPRLPAAVLALLLGPGVAAAGPADPLLRLAPPDAAFCVVVQNLRDHVRAANGSPFAGWFAGSPLGERFAAGPEVKKVRAAAAFLREQLGVTGDELLDDVFGDAVVFAYRPGPPDKPADEAGLILVRPRKPDLLARVVARLNELQTASGELRAVREQAHRDRAYTAREKAAGGSEFYLLRDGVFAFSGQEAALKALIDRDLDAPPAADKPPAVAAGLKRLGVQDKAAVLWVNPRGMDAALAAKSAAAADPGERAFLGQFAKVWAAADGLAAFAHPDRGLEVGVVAGVRRDQLPAELAAVAFPPAGGSAAWAAVPDDAIVAVGGRADLPKLLDAVGSFLPGDGKRALRAAVDQGLGPVFGRDKLPAVVRGVGPDWAAWVRPPDGGGKAWLPRAAAAVRLADAGVARSVGQAIDLGFQLGRVGYNQGHPDQIEFGEEKQGDVTVKALANDAGFPAGLRPCYAVKGGYLVLATNPGEVAGFDPPAGPAAAADPPLLRVSARHAREYLGRHREPLAAALAAGRQRPAKDVAKELGELATVLEAFDRLEVRTAAESDRVTVSVRVELAKPLK